MEDRLIFRYHLDRANPEPELLRKALHLGGPTDPLDSREAKGGRRRVRGPRRWSSWGKEVGGPPRQIRVAVNAEIRCRAASGEATDPMLPRKASSEWSRCPYPKPTQVGR